MAGKFFEPQTPLMQGGDFYYPQTTAKQIILSDGSRLEKNGEIIVNKSNIADKLSAMKSISLTGDVTGSVNFDGSSSVTITTVVSTSKYATHNDVSAAITNALNSIQNVSGVSF